MFLYTLKQLQDSSLWTVSSWFIFCLFFTQAALAKSNYTDNYDSHYYQQNIKFKPAVVIPAETNHTGTIIFLHGVGDTGEDYAIALESIREPYMKIICPCANAISLQVVKNKLVPAWFDIKRNSDNETREDFVAIARCSSYLYRIINEEVNNGIRPERIIIGGINQGAAIALHAGLAYSKQLAGIISYSGWLPLHTSFFEIFNPANRKISVFVGHGDQNRIIPFIIGKLTARLLSDVSPNAKFKAYPGIDHTISEEGMNDIRLYMKKRVKPL